MKITNNMPFGVLLFFNKVIYLINWMEVRSSFVIFLCCYVCVLYFELSDCEKAPILKIGVCVRSFLWICGMRADAGLVCE